MTPKEADMTKAALVYDFDGTLSEGDCAEHGLLPELGITDVPGFWNKVKSETENRDADEILTYLGSLALQARLVRKREELTAEKLQIHGKKIPLFPGVAEWFGRINSYAKQQNIVLEHYIVSSGIEEMIQGTPISKHFTRIFGCRYHYDKKTGYVKWPAVAINYTTKTQYIFRINKGVLNCYDNRAVNEYVEHNQRTVPFERMIYLGDGETDVPAMKMIKYQGGKAIAVYDPNKKGREGSAKQICEKLIEENRADYICPTDYSENSKLDLILKSLIEIMSKTEYLNNL